jgi:branched-chain amino acid aminotransferase
VPIVTHALHYGFGVFEGMRCYKLDDGRRAIFRLKLHIRRLFDGLKILTLEPHVTPEQMMEASLETVRVNGLEECYIRPIVFRGSGTFSVDGRSVPTHMSIITVYMGKYLGPDALEKGVDVGVSSWRRMAPGTYPAAAKISGQYVNSQFVVMEAVDHGYTEGIALDVDGLVSEGSGENIFVVRQGCLYTPPLASSILDGITRRCVLTLAEELGLEVREERIPREFLYLGDEVFFCGTAAEITPIRSVDGVQVGDGTRGPVTAQLMAAFFDIVEGRVPDRHSWLTPVR